MFDRKLVDFPDGRVMAPISHAHVESGRSPSKDAGLAGVSSLADDVDGLSSSVHLGRY
jgi:hypothetical protein